MSLPPSGAGPVGRALVSGPQLFARYAYPPNALGYCGPADHSALFEYGSAGVTDAGLVDLARGFHGAWPYLELIAQGTGIRDPLDRRVVEAYWIGSPLLDRVSAVDIGNSMEDRFRSRTGHQFSHLAEGVVAGGVPHHSFHVFEVYPWVGLLRDDRKAPTAVSVLDRCRIRWGTVESVVGDRVVVRSRPIVWDGRVLSLGEAVTETAEFARGGTGFIDDLLPGDVVSLHWHWVCDRLTAGELTQLQKYTARHLAIANSGVEHRGTALAIG
ncbi:MAG: DUF6390 family protein [Actinomycetota bacterium]|nr:DUF6390 family protein [Actinomycetota bacterium]